MNLFDDFRDALYPATLIDLFQKDEGNEGLNLLKSFMEAFHYKNHAGMVLIYDTPEVDEKGRAILKRIYPSDEMEARKSGNFNPFCAHFRERPEWNQLCEDCDDRHARQILGKPADGKNHTDDSLKIATGRVGQYPCHMGVYDMTFPIVLAGKIKAVICGGQKIQRPGATNLRDRSSASKQEQDPERGSGNWLQKLLTPRNPPSCLKSPLPIENSLKECDTPQLRVMEGRLDQLLRKAGFSDELRTAEKIRLLDIAIGVAEPEARVNAFRESFESLGKSLQKIIDALYQVRVDAARAVALVKVDEFLASGVNEPSDEIHEFDEQRKSRVLHQIPVILDELEEFLSPSSLWLLVRNGSDYEALAASSVAKGQKAPKLRAQSVFEIDAEQFIEPKENTSLYKEIIASTGWISQLGALCRLKPLNSVADSMSLVLYVRPAIRPELREFLIKCFKSMSFVNELMDLYEQMHYQAVTTAKRMAFLGHHLKTPFQTIFTRTWELSEHSDFSPIGITQLRGLIQSIDSKSREIYSDVLALQTEKFKVKETFDFRELLEHLISDASGSAREKQLEFDLRVFNDFRPKVKAIKAKVRIPISAILDNAIKYSWNNRVIRIFLRESKNTGQLMLTIQNIGEGFTPEYLSRLFVFGARGTESKRHGFGLGLAHAKGYIEETGGTIEIRSQPESTSEPETANVSPSKTPPHIVSVIITIPAICAK